MAGYSEQFISNPQATAAEREAFAEGAVEQARELLRRQRYRVEVQRTTSRRGQLEISASAERGYLRETGNLVFHLALLGVLVSVAIGGLFSFNGQKVLVEGETMVNQLIDYDSATSGRWFDSSRLDPYRMRLDDLEVDYVTPEDGNDAGVGMAKGFTASVTVLGADGEERAETIRVNHPLRVLDSPVYLVANGYAPTITVRNASGDVVFSESVPFIPQDQNLTSLGVVKVPYGIEFEGEPTQLGLQGFFYPTKADLGTGAFTSSYPDLANPLLTLNVFVGDLGIDDGVPQSVYALDTSAMTAVASRTLDVKPVELTIGQTVDLPDGMGTITLEAVPRYASFDVMHNPAQEWILVFALLAVAGLLTSLFVPRRRMWVKALPVEGGVRLEYAALARGDDPTLEQAVAQLREQHRERL
jgi:cytochrome c biogenesis protein